MKKQRSFSIIEVLLVLAVLAIVGVVSYLASTNFVTPKSNNTADTTVKSDPIKVESKKDLETAETALDTVSLDDTDSSALDGATNDF